jgi:hydrogenase 3 maturation protease
MNIWKKALRTARQQAEDRLGRPLRLAVLGLGQELRGDDAAGLEAARGLLSRVPESGEINPGQRLLVAAAGPGPENFTGLLRRFRPDLVLLIDAAQMEAVPGEVRWLDPAETSGLSASTHTFPLHVLAEYLAAELGCQTALIGIQPEQNELGAPLSTPVRAAVQEITSHLAKLCGSS